MHITRQAHRFFRAISIASRTQSTVSQQATTAQRDTSTQKFFQVQSALKLEISPKLKVEQTSHIKVTTSYPIEGEYVAGKVVGDKRSRLYYRPDSFILNTIPSQYQVTYGSKAEAELNFYKPDMSVKGEVVYVSLRSTDYTLTPGTNTTFIREMYEKVGVIDAKNPIIDWQFTPYRGTILDDLGQEMPVLVKAYIDKGGVTQAPLDSRFTYAINYNNSTNRTVDTTALAYTTYNYIDPWHLGRKWDLKESYAQYYNQAYTRSARIVYSPYEVDQISNCTLADKYDCFGMEKITVEPEGINLIPSTPCVDPLSYRQPLVNLTSRLSTIQTTLTIQTVTTWQSQKLAETEQS